jgi:hypothetical protein
MGSCELPIKEDIPLPVALPAVVRVGLTRRSANRGAALTAS